MIIVAKMRKFYLSVVRTEQEGVLLVDGWSSSGAPNLIEYELEEDHHFFMNYGNYLLINDKLVYDPTILEKRREEEKKRQEEEDKRKTILNNIENILKQKDDEIEELKGKVDMLTQMNEDYIVLISTLLSELGRNPLDDPPAEDDGGEVPVEEEA